MAKTMVSWQAFPSFPPSSRAPRVSLAPKTPFPFPFLTPATQAINYSVEYFHGKYWPVSGVQMSANGEWREWRAERKKTSGRESKKKTICQLLHNGVRIFTLSEFNLLSSLTRS